MFKLSQVFGWAQEPAQERPSQFRSTQNKLSEFESLASRYDATQRVVATELAAKSERAPPSQFDAVLTPLVEIWMEVLPAHAHPRLLNKQFPRISNRLALCWPDPALTVRLLDNFITDKRGTRRGFPRGPLEELRVLRKLAAERLRPPTK
jgi:hypothetical protein